MTGQERIIENAFRVLEEMAGIRVCYWPLGVPKSGGSAFRMANPNHSSHTCSYCTRVKAACNTDWCLRSKAFGIEKAARSEDGYDGLCYMGVHDLVFPIRLDGQLLGILYFTGFRQEREAARAERLIRRGCLRMGADAEEILREYRLLPCLSDAQMASLRSSAEYLKEILLIVLRTFCTSRSKAVSREISKRQWLEESVLPYVNANYHSDLTLTRLADIFYVSPQYLCRAFKEQTGSNFKQYIALLRVREAQDELRRGERSIAEISRQVGWSDPNYFSRVFRELTGVSPTGYREQTKKNEDEA